MIIRQEDLSSAHAPWSLYPRSDASRGRV